MKNYYVPEVNEFYEGFEYEAKNSQIVDKYIPEGMSASEYYSTWEKKTYKNELVKMDKFLETPTVHFREVRVRYLDSKDIKELGWNLVMSQAHKDTYQYKAYFLEIFIDSGKVVIHKTGAERVTFNIKNKNKLIEVMKDLGLLKGLPCKPNNNDIHPEGYYAIYTMTNKQNTMTLLSKYSCSTYIKELEEIAIGLAKETKPVAVICENQQSHIFNCEGCHLYKHYVSDTSLYNSYRRSFDTMALNLFLSSK